jgi:hypothetical protein
MPLAYQLSAHAAAGGPVKTVGVCGGSGAFLIRAALSKGADFYVSADIKYHEFFDANGQMVIATLAITRASSLPWICCMTSLPKNSLLLPSLKPA